MSKLLIMQDPTNQMQDTGHYNIPQACLYDQLEKKVKLGGISHSKKSDIG